MTYYSGHRIAKGSRLRNVCVNNPEMTMRDHSFSPNVKVLVKFSRSDLCRPKRQTVRCWNLIIIIRCLLQGERQRKRRHEVQPKPLERTKLSSRKSEANPSTERLGSVGSDEFLDKESLGLHWCGSPSLFKKARQSVWEITMDFDRKDD